MCHPTWPSVRTRTAAAGWRRGCWTSSPWGPCCCWSGWCYCCGLLHPCPCSRSFLWLTWLLMASVCGPGPSGELLEIDGVLGHFGDWLEVKSVVVEGLQRPPQGGAEMQEMLQQQPSLEVHQLPLPAAWYLPGRPHCKGKQCFEKAAESFYRAL